MRAACRSLRPAYSVGSASPTHHVQLARSPGESCVMPSSGPASTAPSDRVLVAQAAAGDERAVATLYDRYGVVLYAVAYRIVGQRADAEEVVIEAFTQAWRDAARFDVERGSVAAWLTTIARSRALDLVRARGRRERVAESAAQANDSSMLPATGAQPDPSDSAEQIERRYHVQLALDLLSPSQRQA